MSAAVSTENGYTPPLITYQDHPEKKVIWLRCATGAVAEGFALFLNDETGRTLEEVDVEKNPHSKWTHYCSYKARSDEQAHLNGKSPDALACKKIRDCIFRYLAT